MRDLKITEQLNIEDYGNSNMEAIASGTFIRTSGNFRRVFRHCRKLYSYNAKKRLQIFVLWELVDEALTELQSLADIIDHYTNQAAVKWETF